MDQVTGTREIGEALAARSKSTSLGELAGRGQERVKVIRASDIAAMITETVHRVVEGAGDRSCCTRVLHLLDMLVHVSILWCSESMPLKKLIQR